MSQAAAPPSRVPNDAFLRVCKLLVVPVAFLIVWEIVGVAVQQPTILPTPLEVAASIGDGVASGWLISGIGATLGETAFAFVISVVAGIVIGAVIASSSFLRRVLDPYLTALWATPKIVLFPFFLFLFKLGIGSKVALGVSFGLFPAIEFTIAGVDAVKPVHLRTAQAYGYSRAGIFLRVVVPSAIPEILTGIRYAFTLSFLGVVIGELFVSHEGLGANLAAAQGIGDARRVLSLLILITAIGLAGTGLLLWLENAIGRRLGRQRTEESIAF